MFRKLFKNAASSIQKERGFIIGQDTSGLVVSNAPNENLSSYYFLKREDAIEAYHTGIAKLYNPGTTRNANSIYSTLYNSYALTIDNEFITIPVMEYPFRAIARTAQPSNAGITYQYYVLANDGTTPGGYAYNPSNKTLTLISNKYALDGTGTVSLYNFNTSTITNYSNVNYNLNFPGYNAFVYTAQRLGIHTYAFADSGNVSFSDNDGQTWGNPGSISTVPGGYPGKVSGAIRGQGPAGETWLSLCVTTSLVSVYYTSNVLSSSWLPLASFSHSNEYETVRYGPTIAVSTPAATSVACVTKAKPGGAELTTYRYNTTSGATLTNTLLDIRPTSIACDNGNVFVVVGHFRNYSTGTTNVLPKIAVSIDLGLTWRLADTRDALSNSIINCAALNVYYGAP